MFVEHFQRPKESYHLPQCWLRLNGTNLLVEKKNSDTNWLINDSKVDDSNLSWISFSSTVFEQHFYLIRFYASMHTFVKIWSILGNSKFDEWKFCITWKMERFRWNEEYLLFNDIISNCFCHVKTVTDCWTSDRQFGNTAGMHRETTTCPVRSIWFQCSKASENFRSTLHNHRLR